MRMRMRMLWIMMVGRDAADDDHRVEDNKGEYDKFGEGSDDKDLTTNDMGQVICSWLVGQLHNVASGKILEKRDI